MKISQKISVAIMLTIAGSFTFSFTQSINALIANPAPVDL